MSPEEREKNRIAVRKYHSSHRELINGKARARYRKNPEYTKEWLANHPEEAKKARKKWYDSHADQARAAGRLHYQKNLERNRELSRKAKAAWRLHHPRECSEYRKRWRAEHFERVILGEIVKRMMTDSSCKKNSPSCEYVGCSPEFLRNHIEEQFQLGMTWENYGEWHVDHIVPLSWWDFRMFPDHLFIASHWSNLQPMWAKDNLSKHNRYASTQNREGGK